MILTNIISKKDDYQHRLAFHSCDLDALLCLTRPYLNLLGVTTCNIKYQDY